MIQPIRINLADWRLAQQQRHLRRALLVLIGAVAAGLLLPMALSRLLEQQQLTPCKQDIQRLLTENDRLAEQIQRTTRLQHGIQQHRRQLLTINDLQRARSAPLHQLDQLASATPQSIQLSRLAEQQGLITLEGTAQAAHLVSAYVARLAQFRGFEQIQLVETAKARQDESARTRFTLSLQTRGQRTADHISGPES